MARDPEELALPSGNLAEFLIDLSCLEVVFVMLRITLESYCSIGCPCCA
jgi:hypothetical protein